MNKNTLSCWVNSTYPDRLDNNYKIDKNADDLHQSQDLIYLFQQNESKKSVITLNSLNIVWKLTKATIIWILQATTRTKKLNHYWILDVEY